MDMYNTTLFMSKFVFTQICIYVPAQITYYFPKNKQNIFLKEYTKQNTVSLDIYGGDDKITVPISRDYP